MIKLYTRPKPDVTVSAAPVSPKGSCYRVLSAGSKRGAIAQLGERFNGIEEVVGSIPSGSTKYPEKQASGSHRG